MQILEEINFVAKVQMEINYQGLFGIYKNVNYVHQTAIVPVLWAVILVLMDLFCTHHQLHTLQYILK